MNVIAVIMTPIIFVIALSNYHNHRIIQHLKSYQCDRTLYDLVKHAKESAVGFCERTRVETSTKSGQTGRYIIPILLEEFQRYRNKDKQAILNYLKFTFTTFNNFINDENVTQNTDIIFGVDKDKGKIYLDYGSRNISLKCLESTGKIKIYKKQASHADVLSVKDSQGEIEGHHYRVDPYKNEQGDYVYWIAETVDGRKTYYTRPYLPLIDVLDFVQFFFYNIARGIWKFLSLC